MKHFNEGKWYPAGEEDNTEFPHFVETWLQDWVGYVEESVFDVNVLMLDEQSLLCCKSIIKLLILFLRSIKLNLFMYPSGVAGFFGTVDYIVLHLTYIEKVHKKIILEIINDYSWIYFSSSNN